MRTTRWSRARRATRPGTWRRRSRSPCTASACSRRSVAATTPWTTSCRQADELRATEVHKARTLSRVSFALGAIPEAILAVVARSGRGPHGTRRAERGGAGGVLRDRGHGQRTRRAARHAARDDAGREAATDRYLQVMDTGSTVRDPEQPVAPAGRRTRRARASSSCGVHFAHPGPGACGHPRRHRPGARAGGDDGARRAHRQRQDDPAPARCRVSTTSPRAASGSTVSTSGT